MTDRPGSSRLDGRRRQRELSAVADGSPLDLLVVGGGTTGAGIALDAATRGLRVALVEKHDLAFGTSRWSSKLVHGGLRYLASGQVRVAWESAVERGILMTRTAPHLVRPLPQVIAMRSGSSGAERAAIRAGLAAGDLLRAAAGTSADVLPRSGRIRPSAVRALAPTVRSDGLRGGAKSWDGQLVDDARLVVAVARTAARYGAKILTRVGAYDVERTSARLRDELTGEDFTVRAGAVVNAAGVWAGEVDPAISLRPSRGTHLVFDAATFGGLTCSLTVPVPGEKNRFVFALPAPLGRVYAGLTDVAVDGDVPDVPVATDAEIDFLLDVLGTAVDPPPTRADIVGTFAGLRPLLDGDGPTSDISRRHAVLSTGSGPVSVVGGKLTTYRRMAQDTVDIVAAGLGVDAGPCRTHSIPLVGACAVAGGSHGRAASSTLVQRYGTEVALVLALAESMPGGLEPVAESLDVCAAELAFSVRYEGARTAADLLDRRTRIGLVLGDRERARAVAENVVAQHAS